jgi:hypothetical protein
VAGRVGCDGFSTAWLKPQRATLPGPQPFE